MKLGLGTVQFGLDYGVSNKQGMTPQAQVKEILEVAYEQGVAVLDTAALYGKSEEVLGASLLPIHDFNIVTKTPQFKKQKIDRNDALKLKECFEASLTKLGKQNIYGLLMHRADDLLAEGGEHLMEMMLELKAAGLVKKIGISVYDGDQIDRILEQYSIDIVQLPVNIFDQRLLVSGKIRALKNADVEIHARSVFLQGLLLMPLAQIPDYFAPLEPLLLQYHGLLSAYEMSPLQGALSFMKSCEDIGSIILGVSSMQDLIEILHAWQTTPEEKFDFNTYACSDERMINPALWQLPKH